jgi:hypothetical protein
VTVHIAQDFQTKGTLLQELLNDNFTRVSSFSGLDTVEVFKQKPSDRVRGVSYVIHTGQTYAQVRVQMLDKNQQQVKADELAKVAATNLLRLSQNPEGQLVATYRNSPTFKTTYLRACTVLGEDSMKALGFAHAGPYATETMTTATGVATFASLDDPNPYVYVQNKCERDGIQTDKSVGGHVALATTTYTTDKGAQQDIASAGKAAKNKTAVSGIGDEAMVTKDGEGNEHFIVRKGRLLIDMVYTKTNQKTSDVATYKTTAQPLAEQVLSSVPQL